jgi:16S rRNA (cytosine1402-N4)-methyltransferase
MYGDTAWEIINMTQWIHKPILLEEITKNLITNKDGIYIDATVGLGGHTKEFLKHLSNKAKIIAFDKDKDAIKIAKKNVNDKRVVFVNKSYTEIKQEVDEINGILFDFGISSYQLDNPEKGFSFRFDGPLDMRFDSRDTLTAEYIVNNYNIDKLEQIIRNYGEDRNYKKIANAIVEERRLRPINSTLKLKSLIEKVSYQGGRINPATKTFQALRIEVNSELENVENGIDIAKNFIKVGGVIAVITFHSLEDRIVKNIFRDLKKTKNWQLINKKVITASREEVKQNPRSKSAKLRLIKRIA